MAVLVFANTVFECVEKPWLIVEIYLKEIFNWDIYIQKDKGILVRFGYYACLWGHRVPDKVGSNTWIVCCGKLQVTRVAIFTTQHQCS